MGGGSWQSGGMSVSSMASALIPAAFLIGAELLKVSFVPFAPRLQGLQRRPEWVNCFALEAVCQYGY